MGAFPGIDSAAPGVEQGRFFHQLNDVDDDIEAGSTLTQLLIAAGDRAVEKCAVGRLELFAHGTPLNGARPTVKCDGNGGVIGG